MLALTFLPQTRHVRHTHYVTHHDLSELNQSVIGHRSSVIGHRSSVIGHRSSVIGHRSSVIGHRSSVIGHRSSVIGHRSSVIGHRSSVIGHRSSVIGHRSSVIGHRSSVIGHRSSVIGHQSSDRVAVERNHWESSHIMICSKQRIIFRCLVVRDLSAVFDHRGPELCRSPRQI